MFAKNWISNVIVGFFDFCHSSLTCLTVTRVRLSLYVRISSRVELYYFKWMEIQEIEQKKNGIKRFHWNGILFFIRLNFIPFSPEVWFFFLEKNAWCWWIFVFDKKKLSNLCFQPKFFFWKKTRIHSMYYIQIFFVYNVIWNTKLWRIHNPWLQWLTHNFVWIWIAP